MKKKNMLWKQLQRHFGHKVEIAIYGDIDDPANISLEDVDTNEVIIDAGIYDLKPFDPEEPADLDNETVNTEKIRRAEQCLIDNGIETDEAEIVLEALVYILMDKDLNEVR